MSQFLLTDIRKKFLNYFKQNNHEIVDSSNLVPNNDPTVMFTNSGMVQFKNLFTGLEKRDYLNYKGFPKTDLLQFITEEGMKVSIRPSGTEPKIKFYFSICKKIKSYVEIKETFLDLKLKVNKVKKELINFMNQFT